LAFGPALAHFGDKLGFIFSHQLDERLIARILVRGRQRTISVSTGARSIPFCVSR